jgi:hypothetical protein
MKPSSPTRTAIKVLVFTILWIAFEHVMGWNTTKHEVGQFARLVPAFVFWTSVFIVVRNKKRSAEGVTFIEGWRAGVLTSIVYSIGFTLVIIIYQQFINPEFYETLKAFTLQNLQLRNASQEQIDSSMKELEMSYNGSATSYVLLFVFSLAWGILLSAIAASIYKTRKPVSTSN